MISNYTLHNKIGKGGYSTVYKCTDKVGLSYACKKVLKSKVEKHRIINEIEIMKSLCYCPTTIKLIEAGEDEDNYYIIQELCKKGSLADYIVNHKVKEEKEVIKIVRGILCGLYHVHEHNIVHCDVKLGNIFVFEDCNDVQLKLGDFGNSIKLGKDIEENKHILSGTPHFMSPEVLSHTYDTKSDIWSLGVMTYELISGTLPFNDRNNKYNPSINMLWKSIFNDNPTFKETAWENISDLCQDFIKQCLIKDFNTRPSTLACLEHPWLLNHDCIDVLNTTQILMSQIQ
jgi:calcium-dependent protein kinase